MSRLNKEKAALALLEITAAVNLEAEALLLEETDERSHRKHCQHNCSRLKRPNEKGNFMDLPGNLRVICRLCCSSDLSLHWEDGIAGSCGLTYKECFYKYTRIEESGEKLSQYLCHDCAIIIKNFHWFVEKAAEVLRLCQKQVLDEKGYVCDDGSGVNLFADPNENIECLEINNIEIVRDTDELSQNCREADEDSVEDCLEHERNSSSEYLSDSTGNNEKCWADAENFLKCNINGSSTNINKIYDDNEKSDKGQLNTVNEEGILAKNKVVAHGCNVTSTKSATKTPGMCSYCSKLVYGTYYLKTHEKTHEMNRQRTEACPTCNVKLYDKRALYQHMKVHEEDRVRKYKCEFCEKAFYSRGACNVHRRIHLGQMYHCLLCPKQFYRQLDLDRHMPQHSHESLNSLNRTQSKRYYVHCKECNKKIASNRFRGHQATHMNIPFMSCTLCKKDFFNRRSGGQHMACVHKRKGGNYDDITLYYQSKESPRLSLLLKRQQEDVQPVNFA